MRRTWPAAVRSTATCVFALCLAVVSASCSGDDDGQDGPDGSDAGGGTVAVATLPPVATTVVTAPAPTAAPAVTVASTTAAPAAVATTAGPSSTVAPTTTRPATTTSAAPAPPCQLALIVEQTQTAYLGITPSDLACAEDWAAWIGRPEDELADGFFAVARWVGGSWELMNLGTAGVCADSGVPDELWTELGCFE
jgi:hypothetical protein